MIMVVSPEENPQGSSGETFSATMSDMAVHSFDDPDLQAAMVAFLDAGDAIDSAVDDADLLRLADAKRVAGLALRQRLLALGWTAPVGQRSTR
jgi:hypothetical protein